MQLERLLQSGRRQEKRRRGR